jgi:hypothetical protein
MDKSSKSEEKYEFRAISKLSTMESITNTEDMLCNVLILAFIVNVSLKSRVRENCKHGSVGDVVVMTVLINKLIEN